MATDKSDNIPLVNAVEITPVSGSTVEVVAPMDLHEGYKLQVSVNGSQRTVTVPPGGVKQGDSFQAQPFVDPDSAVLHQIPVGRWRDGLCDCCMFGCCHPMCCLGYWCEPILVGQVMTRMSRDWCGGPGHRPSASNTCQIVTGIWFVVLLFQSIISIVMDTQSCFGGRMEYNIDTNQSEIHCPDGTIEQPSDTYQALRTVSGLAGSLFAVYLLIGICRTRQAMRRKYNIQAGGCGDACEDCCCSFWCSCCTVQQMARHTNDYSTHDIKCCSNDCFNNRGQQEQVPEIDP